MAGPLFVCRHPRRVLEMISRKSSILLLIAISFALSGCDSMLGVKPPVVSTTPNQEQVDYCRKVMYINPEIAISSCHRSGPHACKKERSFLASSE